MRVAIIGAGAAGIAAARATSAAGHDAVVFEARDRVGGRTLTDHTLAAHPVELGAEFIHGELVTTWDWVREFDAPTNGDAHRYEAWNHFRGELVPASRVAEALGSELSPGLAELTRAWNEADRPDAPMTEVLATWPDHFGRVLADEDRALAANVAAQGTSADLEQLGAHRIREANYGDSGTLRHWRLPQGYSALMARAAAGLDIRLATPVTRVRWSQDGASLTTSMGEERFDAVIVTLPLGVLQRGAVEFDPPLPAAKRDAIIRLNAGHISKVILKFDRVYWPPELTFLWTPLDTQLWWRPGQGQPNEEPLLTAFFGGADAARLEDATREEAIAEATRQLGDMLGQSLDGHVLDGRYLAWGAEQYTRMGYSSVPPGGLGLRNALAQSVGALHFAARLRTPRTPPPSTAPSSLAVAQPRNWVRRGRGDGAPHRDPRAGRTAGCCCGSRRASRGAGARIPARGRGEGEHELRRRHLAATLRAAAARARGSGRSGRGARGAPAGAGAGAGARVCGIRGGRP